VTARTRTEPRLVADQHWEGRWVGADEGVEQGTGEIIRVPGTIVPGLRDHHVHLGLVDRDELAQSALSAVDDLGWIAAEALEWKASSPGGCRVRVAGPFLTAPGGYPFGRVWAPAGAVRAVDSRAVGSAAVAELADLGVDAIKVVLHTGLPPLHDEALQGIVGAAHEHELPVVAHVEGPGQAARAAAAGIDTLAHTPWTETVSDEVLSSMPGRTAWISTLAIHPLDSEARQTATDNLVRFVSAGGRVLYGTDMGNGPTPVGLNIAEVEALVHAGLKLPTIMDAICVGPSTAALPRSAQGAGRDVTWTQWPPPVHVPELPAWMATLRRRPISDFGAAS
jgi:imidazolonepropionase-like amidohydrolase